MLCVKLHFIVRYHTMMLTDHFIRYTLLAPGWLLLCLQNCLYSLWGDRNIFFRFWSILMTEINTVDCWQYIHDTNLPLHHIPKISVGLRSGDCRGHLSTVNTTSCSRNQLDIIQALWDIGGSSHQKMVRCGDEGTGTEIRTRQTRQHFINLLLSKL